MTLNSRAIAGAAFVALALAVAIALIRGPFWVEPPKDTSLAASRSAEAVLPELLTQVYRAFSLEDEAQIYDALAKVVAGDLVSDLYLQRRAAQVASHAEDNETTILGVEVYEIAPLPTEDGAAFSVAWRVVGRLRHIAHIHERINLYSADLTLAPDDGQWKLTAFTLTNTQRTDDLDFEGGE